MKKMKLYNRERNWRGLKLGILKLQEEFQMGQGEGLERRIK